MNSKKTLAFLIITLLIVSLSGGLASAAGPSELYIGSTNIVLPSDGDTVYENLSESDSSWWVINENGVIKLFLNNLTVVDSMTYIGSNNVPTQNTEDELKFAAVYASYIDEFIIVVRDGTENILGSKNELLGSDSYGVGLYTEGCNVTITGEEAGSGVLKCYACATLASRGIWINYMDDMDNSLVIKSCTLEAFGGSYGISVDFNIDIEDAVINAESGSLPFNYTDYEIRNSYENVAIHSHYGNISFIDSNVTAVSSGSEEIFACAISTYNGDISITRGQLYAELNTNLNGNAIYPGRDLYVDSAQIEMISSMDGLWLEAGVASFTGNAKVDSDAVDNAFYAYNGFSFDLSEGGYVYGVTEDGSAFTTDFDNSTFADNVGIVLPKDGAFLRDFNSVDNIESFKVFDPNMTIAYEARIAFVAPQPNPPTGDSAKVLQFVCAAVLSMLIITFICFKKRKNVD